MSTTASPASPSTSTPATSRNTATAMRTRGRSPTRSAYGCRSRPSRHSRSRSRCKTCRSGTRSTGRRACPSWPATCSQGRRSWCPSRPRPPRPLTPLHTRPILNRLQNCGSRDNNDNNIFIHPSGKLKLSFDRTTKNLSQ